MSGPGSGGNVLAALCSFFVPGLGQLLQGRLFTAAIHFVLFIALWFFWLGIIMHLWSCYSAARYLPPMRPLP
jgi:TM2 domain-containing membrane protein YozV